MDVLELDADAALRRLFADDAAPAVIIALVDDLDEQRHDVGRLLDAGAYAVVERRAIKLRLRYFGEARLGLAPHAAALTV